MAPDMAAELLGRTLFVVTRDVGLLLLPGLVTGLVISIVQAATQITEQTLSFLPRLLVTLATLIVAGRWLLGELSRLFVELYTAVPYSL
ncbi:MAG: flagellar biosynthetic protein FliQ [Kistimonas sp.]|nr:flagellar biosynthetic protein FliQ [Kistimonas sp.]